MESEEYEKARDRLVHQAAIAIEMFGEDELEEYAKELYEKEPKIETFQGTRNGTRN